MFQLKNRVHQSNCFMYAIWIGWAFYCSDKHEPLVNLWKRGASMFGGSYLVGEKGSGSRILVFMVFTRGTVLDTIIFQSGCFQPSCRQALRSARSE